MAEEKKNRHTEAYNAFGRLINQSSIKIKELQVELAKLREACLVLAAERDAVGLSPSREKDLGKLCSAHRDKKSEIQQEQVSLDVFARGREAFGIESQINWERYPALLEAFNVLDRH